MVSEEENDTCINTDKELWREPPGDFYSDSIHVTEDCEIGIDHKGHVFVALLHEWHRAGELYFYPDPNKLTWKQRFKDILRILRGNHYRIIFADVLIWDDNAPPILTRKSK